MESFLADDGEEPGERGHVLVEREVHVEFGVAVVAGEPADADGDTRSNSRSGRARDGRLCARGDHAPGSASEALAQRGNEFGDCRGGRGDQVLDDALFELALAGDRLGCVREGGELDELARKLLADIDGRDRAFRLNRCIR